MQGKHWKREPTSKNKLNSYSLKYTLSPESAAMIRNLVIHFTIGSKDNSPKGIPTGGISQEDHELYAIRDTMRQFAEYIAANNSLNILKGLKVRPTVYTDYSWKADEAIVALFFALEPLQDLNTQQANLDAPITRGRYGNTAAVQLIENMHDRQAYIQLEKRWLKALADPSAAPGGSKPSNTTLKATLRKIDAFAQLVHVQDATTSRSWTSTGFQQLARPLHLARVAYENGDETTMTKIQEAINLRWVNAYRQQQDSLRAVADSINTMFEQDSMNEGEEGDGKPTPRELYPDAYNFDDCKPLKQPYSSNQSQHWPELNAMDPVPKRGEAGVTVKMSGLRYTICKDGQEWVRLKTPAFIRESRSEK